VLRLWKVVSIKRVMSHLFLAPQLVEAVQTYLAEHAPVIAAVIFGSAAGGPLRPDSDVDLALLFAAEQVPGEDEILEMRADLEQLLRRDVDLIVLNQASPILAFQAARHGTLLFCRDRRAYERFLVRLITEYADFKRIRRPIEEAVLARRIL
jgi:uncharacterized protein